MTFKGQTDAEQLLKHLPEYSVVICRACKFAIQPRALKSHLLRHQVYRNDRRQLLNNLSQLGLREPEEVPTPSPDSAPLPGLPVHRGFICLKAGCSHSCVSHKRMSQHWSEVHDEHDSKNVQARSAALQTFFRGNKIRYFEVNSNQLPTPESPTATLDASDKGTPGIHPLLSPTSSTSDDESNLDPFPPIDLPSIRYFHHYIMTPSLIPHRGERESQQFWMVTIVEEALKYPVLMYAILAVAATHMSTESQDWDSSRIHREAGLSYHVAALAAFRAAVKEPTTSISTALLASARYIGVHRLLMLQIEFRDGSPSSAHSSRNSLRILTEMVTMPRGAIHQHLRLQSFLPYGSDFVLSEDDLHSLRDVNDTEAMERDVMNAIHIPALLFNRIDVLPETLSSMGTLQDSNEYQTIKQATISLLAGASRSYASAGLAARWNGLETFAHSVSDHFVRMVEEGRPSALVVLAHWVLLIRRLEPHYIFLQGQSYRLLSIIRANLRPEFVALTADIEHTI